MAISNSKFEKLLCIHIDNKLKTEPHVRSQCKKASQRLSAFVRIAHSLKFEQRKLLLNTFVTSQYSDVSVVWMSHNRKSNNHINRIHERALRIAYQRLMNVWQKTVSSKFKVVVYRNYVLKYLKLKWSLLYNHEWHFWHHRMPIPSNKLRCKSQNIRTARYGIETATFADSRIWSYLPSELKEDTLLNKFRLKTKTWKPENLSCKLCKIYLQRIGYLQVTN